MTPERIAEFRDAIANHPHFGIGGDALSKILDALEATQAEIADLKRGGVDAAELDAISDATRRIGNDAHHASTGPVVPDALWDIRSRAYDVCARIDGIRAIPADRVLREGEARIGMNELQMLRGFAGRRMSEREYDRLEAVRDAHEDALRAQPTQEPTT